MKNMKKWIAALMVAVMVLSVAAIAGADPVTIRFSWWGGNSRHEATEKAVAAFMAKNPDIIVECEYGAWDGWTEKCATQLNAGTAPDLMQFNWNWIYQFSSDGSKLADVAELGVDLSAYPESILKQCFVAGKQQAVPIGTTGKCFFWNKTTWEKAGLALPETFEDLYAAGKIFQEQLGEGYYPLAMYQYERVLLMLYYLETKYGKNWVEDGQVQYSLEEVTEGLDWICSLEDMHVLPTIAQLQGDGATILEKNVNWANGKYAGFYEWDSANAKFREALEPGQEFALGAFLTGNGEYEAGLTKISQTFAITEASKNKEAAAKLLNYLINDEEGISILNTERGMLANSKANDVLAAQGIFDGNLTYTANQAVMAVANFGFDPNFENSELKDSTGVYYEVMENISADHSATADMAQYLLEEIERVQMENPY